MCFCFIKIIVRVIRLGFTLLYMDESSLLSKNNNYKCWRKANENIYFNFAPPKRSNLLLTISCSDIIYYKINRTSTNENIFLEYLLGLKKEIELRNINKYILILDNLSVH